MMIAQKLYEGIEINGETQGLITYMRTDGIYIADGAIKNIRKLISEQFKDEYLPKSPVIYKKKVKNAQEAHESIRPTDVFLTPEKAKQFLTDDQFKLYNLIWKRTVASQMTDAIINSQSISFISEDKRFITYASCSSIEFDGFYKVYFDAKDNITNPEVALFIKTVNKDDKLTINKLNPKQHFTEPPKRYSEAGLIKKMEELGIGRPSTYATIISVLQDRLYAIIQNKAFIPENRGRVVTAFLTHFFSNYVEYNFTANLEDQLDKVADGELNWESVIKEFWLNFNNNIESVDKITINDILKEINKIMKDSKIIKSNTKINDKCPKCTDGQVTLNIGKFGVFLGCTKYPDCKFIIGDSEDGNNLADEFPRQITDDITLNKGPYGLYLKHDKKNISIPKDFDTNLINEEFVRKIINLPQVLGEHPKDNKEIKLGIGPYGLYLLYNKKYYNISLEEIDKINLEKATEIIDNYTKHDKSLIKSLGEKDSEQIDIKDGKYGPYIKYGKLNVAIPKSMDLDNITIDDAIILITKKIQTGKKKVTKKK
jgi:DNA topoisomerase-1